MGLSNKRNRFLFLDRFNPSVRSDKCGTTFKLQRCFSSFISLAIAKIKMMQKNIEEPIVPRFKPPLETGLVRTSPKVAPKGLVRTKAIQKRSVPETFVKKCRNAITTSNADMTIALVINPSPRLSARKSPAAVPSVLAIKKADQ